MDKSYGGIDRHAYSNVIVAFDQQDQVRYPKSLPYELDVPGQKGGVRKKIFLFPV